MKKILVVTDYLSDKIELLNQFMSLGLKGPSVVIFVYQKKNEQKLLEFVRRNRPSMIILDGRINHNPLEIIHDIISNIIGVYDIDSKIYAIKEFVILRGVTNIEIAETPAILESL